MASSYQIVGSAIDKDYMFDKKQTNSFQRSISNFIKYRSTASIMDYNTLFTEEESATYGKINTYVNDYMGQMIPKMIKNGLSVWDEYCTKLTKYGPDKVTKIYQNIVED